MQRANVLSHDGTDDECSRAQETGIRRRGELATLLIVFNPWHDAVNFTLPPSTGGSAWMLRADTNSSNSTDEPRFALGHVYAVTARSLLLFQLN